MHTFKHPKYYTELRKRNREVLRSGRGLAVNQAPHVSDQSISKESSTEENQRSTDPGPKRQASSGKPQAASLEKQASSPEEQASSRKP